MDSLSVPGHGRGDAGLWSEGRPVLSRSWGRVGAQAFLSEEVGGGEDNKRPSH